VGTELAVQASKPSFMTMVSPTHNPDLGCVEEDMGFGLMRK